MADGLEERMNRARSVLQRTTDTHPDFEQRVRDLVRLSEELDRTLESRAVHQLDVQ
jgi:hypothetical protein